MDLQNNYKWLASYPLDAFPMIREALNNYGLHEGVGAADNPTILGWAKDLGIKDYVHDAEPWCGLFMAHCAQVAGEPIPDKPLWALSWRSFGKEAAKPGFGDVLIFKRTDPQTGKVIGGHVGQYIGEDAPGYFHVLGGNESDSVTITRMLKVRLVTARRSLKSPADPKPLILPPSGMLSVKEV